MRQAALAIAAILICHGAGFVPHLFAVIDIG